MILVTLAFLGGVLTILSPCILPVLPFVFARAGPAVPAQRIAAAGRHGAHLRGWSRRSPRSAAAGSCRRISAGRWLRSRCSRCSASTLLSPSFADRLSRPFVALGNRLTTRGRRGRGPRSRLVPARHRDRAALGAVRGPDSRPHPRRAPRCAARTSRRRCCCSPTPRARGVAGAALLLGGRVFSALKRSLGAGEWIRRVLGGAVVVGALAIAFGFDTGFLARVSTPGTTRLEQALFGKLMPAAARSPRATTTCCCRPATARRCPPATAMKGRRDAPRRTAAR